jgi:integrase
MEPLRGWMEAAGIAEGPLWRPVRGPRGVQEAVPRRLDDASMEHALQAWCRRAGIDHPMTLHGLRATFATLALAGGASLYLVQQSMGHRDARTTERYDKQRLSLEQHAGDFLHL